MKRLLVLLLTVALVGLLPSSAGADPRWRFYTKDKTHYTSPWYAGAHRIMVPFGCTRAPYYSPDPRCRHEHGFHHGIDIAMKCGTKLYSPRLGWVVSNDSLGPAYGDNPLLIRNYRIGYDLVIGHTRKVFVEEGDRIKPGMLIAKASDNGAPDGCHLHFERRAVGGGLDTATKPRKLLALAAEE
ncbi:MAG: peptidase [Nocardioides sp.]|nr:peptidase [Nocardioides sp.]